MILKWDVALEKKLHEHFVVFDEVALGKQEIHGFESHQMPQDEIGVLQLSRIRTTLKFRQF
jgi:hypothetical protein